MAEYNSRYQYNTQYEELFGSNLANKIEIARSMKEKLELRRVLMSATWTINGMVSIGGSWEPSSLI